MKWYRQTQPKLARQDWRGLHCHRAKPEHVVSVHECHVTGNNQRPLYILQRVHSVRCVFVRSACWGCNALCMHGALVCVLWSYPPLWLCPCTKGQDSRAGSVTESKARLQRLCRALPRMRCTAAIEHSGHDWQHKHWYSFQRSPSPVKLSADGAKLIVAPRSSAGRLFKQLCLCAARGQQACSCSSESSFPAS